MPLHPSAAAILPLMQQGLELTPDTTPDDVRARLAAASVSGMMPVPEVHAVEDRVVPGSGGDVPVRIYRPSAAPTLPVILWFHGGGWVLGSIDTHDNHCRHLARDVGAIVVSVGYRLAPEAKFPAAVDDCVAAWRWLVDHAAEIGGDPERLAVGGDSAGGNLAAVTCLAAREGGLDRPCFQLLVYPVTDHDFTSASMLDNAQGFGLEAEHMHWFYEHYARSPADHDDWRMSPLRADLHELPPALVITAEFDPLRDQGAAYAEKLDAAGVETATLRVDGLFHGFFGLHEFLEPAKEPWDRAVELLRMTFFDIEAGDRRGED
jgi:acetyl esterase